MFYRKLGRTGIEVSGICLGTMTFGEQNTERDAHEQLDYALEQGINFIDTAEMYPVPPRGETQGLTERHVGSWLKARGNRERVVLASKVAGPARSMDYLRNGPQLIHAHIEQALHASLERLQTDYLDLYQVHWPARGTNFFGRLGYEHAPGEEATPIADTLHALDRFVREGKVRMIGISNETPWGAMEYLRLAQTEALPRIVSIQNPYSLLNRSYEIGLAEVSHREDAGLLAYSPLAFGVLSGKYLHGERPAGARLTLFDRFDRYTNTESERASGHYVQLARDYDLSPAQMALAYVNTRSFLTSTIIGATRMDQLRENIASADVVLSKEVLGEIERIHRMQPNPSP